MPDGLSLIQDLPPNPTLLTVLGVAGVSSKHGELPHILHDAAELRNLKSQVERDRIQLDQFDALLAKYDDLSLGDVDLIWLAQTAQEAREKARTTHDALHPVVEALRSTLAPSGELPPEAEQLVHDCIDMLEGWLSLYRTLQERLTRLAIERWKAAGKVLRARPVEREIDHEALSREFMARYPKIRARLAE
jgi:hypothetical protein